MKAIVVIENVLKEENDSIFLSVAQIKFQFMDTVVMNRAYHLLIGAQLNTVFKF